MIDKPKVEMHLAYFWICESCGMDNFCRGATLEHDTELEWELKERLGFNINDGGQFMCRPYKVTCGKCGDTFETKDTADDDDLTD